jgi:S1-C subfamily serine protease
VGFAIPINTALSIASQIQQGSSSSTVQIGLPAFLGVDVVDASSASGNGGFGGFGGYTPPVSSGALIISMLPSTPAQSAGLVAGDVITVLNGATISSAATLSSALAGDKPGQTISRPGSTLQITATPSTST